MKRKDINDCYCVVQTDGKYNGDSNWACVWYGSPGTEEIPEKFKDPSKYRIAKIGEVGQTSDQSAPGEG